MKHASLFSGIGGFDLAAEWCGWENIFQVEWDPFCQKILKKNFPNAERFSDIKDFDGKPYRGKIDIISGGFPCQPFSLAGKRKGTADDRHLWPEMLRVIQEVQPRFVVGENVGGLVSWNDGLVLEQVLSDLENEGYEAGAHIVPACAVDAPHRRDRVWILAHAKCDGTEARGRCNRTGGAGETAANSPNKGRKRSPVSPAGQNHVGENSGTAPNTDDPRADDGVRDDGNRATENSDRNERQPQLEHRANDRNENAPDFTGFIDWRGLPEPGVFRGDDGIPARMDRVRAIGNSIVPQVAFNLFKSIENAAASTT